MTMSDEQARRFVVALAAELEREVGDMAALLVGPMLSLPPAKVIEIVERVDARYHEIKEQVEP